MRHHTRSHTSDRSVSAVNVRGVWMGDQVKGAVRGAVADGLLEGATEVIEASKKVVPVKTGRLRNSGYSDVDSNTLIAIAGYDDPRRSEEHTSELQSRGHLVCR